MTLRLRLTISALATSLWTIPTTATLNLFRSYSGSTFLDGFDFRDVSVSAIAYSEQ